MSIRRKERDKNKHIERKEVLSRIWSKSTPAELDVIDRGDHLKITSPTNAVAGWWLGTLKAVYPQDHYKSDGHRLTMRPEAGVTLMLDKEHGTLKIKGKRHWDWFRENFENILEHGPKDDPALRELSKEINRQLLINEELTVEQLLKNLPIYGAIRKGPEFIYPLWRHLLDKWLKTNGTVYIVSPLLDAQRLKDILLLVIKHRQSTCRIRIATLLKCDGDDRFSKMCLKAKTLIKDLKGPNKKRLITDERLKGALDSIDVRVGRFNSRFMALCYDDRAELLLTSANFNRSHFDADKGDTVAYLSFAAEDFYEAYIEPLGITGTALTPADERSSTASN